MRYVPLTNWEDKPELECLSVFAMLIDEMTFHYTLDSFRAPTMNVLSLLFEARDVVENIRCGIIREAAWSSLREELATAYEEDTVFKELAKQKGINYAIDAVCSKEAITMSDLFALLQIILQGDLSKSYRHALEEHLFSLVSTNKKLEIERTARLWLTQLVFDNFSLDYVHEVNENFFFGVKTIKDVSCLTDFFSCLPSDDYEYEVVMIANGEFIGIIDILSRYGINTLNVDPISTIFECFKRKKSNYKCFLSQTINAKDMFAARALAFSRLSAVTQGYSFYNHKDTLSVLDVCYVREISTNKDRIISKPVSDIIKCRDSRHIQAKKKFKDIFEMINFSESSLDRITKSMSLHKNALLANNLEDQFINLFTAIEVLIPKDVQTNKDRILQIYDTIVPFLSLHYYRKLLESTLLSLFKWDETYVRALLDDIPEGDSYIDKLGLLITLKKYDKSLVDGKLYPRLAADRFYSMRYRLFKLHKILQKDEILSHMERHEKRLKWHIDRIYRTRNMIVHAGVSPKYLGNLIVNLHYYYDTLVNQLLTENIEHKWNDISLIYVSCFYRFRNYKTTIKECDINDAENMLNFIN